MSRYFFHLNECGTITADEEGREIEARQDVRLFAIEEARTIMAAEVARGKLCLACAIEVVDEQGSRVLALDFREAVEIAGLDGGCSAA